MSAARHDPREPDSGHPRDQPRSHLQRKVRLANGREASALDIQVEYLNRALRYAETKGLPDDEMKALHMWEHVMTQLETTRSSSTVSSTG